MIYPNIAVILTDASRRIQWINHDFTLLTGYTLEDVAGKIPSLLQGKNTNPEDINLIKTALFEKKPFKGSIINYTKEQEEYLCKLVIYPIFNEEKEITNFIAFEINGDKVDDSTLPLLQIQEKYQTSSLRDTDQTSIYIRLCSLMLQEKLYLNPDLSLKDLALKLGTNTRYLSQVINNISSSNLQLFINSYRIAEVKSKIQSPEFSNFTLYGIAQQCGFKNKSTFYKVFRASTGLTPKDFIKKENVH